MFFYTVKKIVKKEFIQTFRDKRMIPLLFIAPVMQLMIFGFAVNMDIKNLPVGYFDMDNSPASREIIRRMSDNPYFKREHRILYHDSVNKLLDKNKAEVIIVIPPGFEKNLIKNGKESIQIIISGIDSTAASIARGYLEAIIMDYNNEYFHRHLMRSGNIHTLKNIPVIVPEIRMLYNQDLRSSNFMVPAIIGMIIMTLMILLTTLAITREREMGTFELLIVSPIKPIQIILGKTVPFFIIGLCDVTLVLVAGKLIFHVPIIGSIFCIYLASAFFILTCLGIGLYISSVSHTQSQAILTMLFILQPAFVLSGFMFPAENMPQLLYYISFLNPLTYFNALIRTLFLKGTVLWGYLVVLIIYSIGIFTFSSLKFNKNLE